MTSNNFDIASVSREQLIEKIEELRMLNDALIGEKELDARLNFPWAANLGNWYWNIKSNKVTFNSLKITNLGYTKEEVPEEVPYQFFTSKLHPDDYQRTMDAMASHLSGKTAVYEIEYRIQHKAGNYKWYYDRGKITAYDDDGNPAFLSGIVFDVTWKKQNEAQMQFRAQQDPLTQLYTKEKAFREINRRLEENSGLIKSGMLVMDIDQFRTVNVANGQMFGDTVLQRIADILNFYIGNGGIAARIGGDEFLLFLSECSEAAFRKTALRFHEEIGSLYISEDRSRRLSASMGVTVSDGGDCSVMVEKAFAALYYVKQFGSNGFAVYEDLAESDLQRDAPHTISHIRPHENWEEENIISFSLRTVEQIMDVKSALHVLYSRIARQYAVDEICVTKAGNAEKASSIHFFWTASDSFVYDTTRLHWETEDLAKRSAWLEKGVPCVLDDSLMERMDRNLRKFLHNERMRSQLICPVWVQGIYQGCLIYGSRRADHNWDERSVQELKELANIQYATICKVNAESSNRAKTEFLSHMSHEIRTPLNAIIGMIEIVKNSMEDAGRVAYCLAKIDGAAHYLLSLVSNVLEMSKIETNEVGLSEEVFSIQEAIHSVKVLMDGVVGKNKTLECQVKCVHDYVRGDNMSLQQVLTNLVVNAIKFTPDDGKIRLLAEELESGAEDRHHYRFSVSDNGIGIAQKDLQRIFQRFEQVEEVIPNQYSQTGLGGVGLGLAISDKLVRLMGGEIEVKSKPGAGSCFSFILEMTQADTPPQPDAAAVEGKLNGKKILIVEDNEWNIEVARDLLEMRGAHVLIARNGKEGVDVFSSSPVGQVDAILMDIRMPIMDGIEAASRIRNLNRSDRNVPIIAVTSDVFDKESYKNLADGMNAHLSKPVDGMILQKTILGCLS